MDTNRTNTTSILSRVIAYAEKHGISNKVVISKLVARFCAKADELKDAPLYLTAAQLDEMSDGLLTDGELELVIVYTDTHIILFTFDYEWYWCDTMHVYLDPAIMLEKESQHTVTI